MDEQSQHLAAPPGFLATARRLFYRYRGVAFNLALLALVLLAQPAIHRRLLLGINRNREDISLGVALVALQLFELWAVRVKLSAIEQRMRASSTDARSGAAGFILWAFHMGVNTALLFPIAGCFGISPNPAVDKTLDVWFLLLATLMVIKELLVLLAINPRWFERARRLARVSARRELLADAALLLYTALSFIVLLEISGMRANFKVNDPLQMIVGLVVAALLMLVLLLPLRLAYIVEEWDTIQQPADAALFVASVIVLLGGALLSFI